MSAFEQVCAGDGIVDLGDWLVVDKVITDITTAGILCEYRSAEEDRRVMHVGWIALGFRRGSDDAMVIQWHKYIEFEREEPVFPNLITCHFLQWHIEGGSEVDVILGY